MVLVVSRLQFRRLQVYITQVFSSICNARMSVRLGILFPKYIVKQEFYFILDTVIVVERLSISQ